jgi:hypothetical protein
VQRSPGEQNLAPESAIVAKAFIRSRLERARRSRRVTSSTSPGSIRARARRKSARSALPRSPSRR